MSQRPHSSEVRASVLAADRRPQLLHLSHAAAASHLGLTRGLTRAVTGAARRSRTLMNRKRSASIIEDAALPPSARALLPKRNFPAAKFSPTSGHKDRGQRGHAKAKRRSLAPPSFSSQRIRNLRSYPTLSNPSIPTVTFPTRMRT